MRSAIRFAIAVAAMFVIIALKALIARWADKKAYFVAKNYAYRGDHDLAQWPPGISRQHYDVISIQRIR